MKLATAALLTSATLLSASGVQQDQLSFEVEVQVVDLQVSVVDLEGSYITELSADDFEVFEDGVEQTPLDVELQRQPFSIGVLLDTSSSMHSDFQSMFRATAQFVQSLMPDDEYFLMTFDDRIAMRFQMQTAEFHRQPDFSRLRFGNQTKLYEGVMSGIEQLKKAAYPRRALFLISDGVNSSGDYGLGDVIKAAQRTKTLVYSLIIRKGATDLYVLGTLSRQTGGTFFVMDGEFPRLKSAYEKIAFDLANRFTLYYRSASDYTKVKKPEIQIKMKNPRWGVRYQRAYFLSN